MGATLIHLYNRKKKLYNKLVIRYRKKSNYFSNSDRSTALVKIRKLAESLRRLSTQIKLAAAGFSGLILGTSLDSNAQTGLGPFVLETDRELHPLRSPLDLPSNRVYPSFADFDGDGDMDLYLSEDSDFNTGSSEIDYIFVSDNRFANGGNKIFVESSGSSVNPFMGGIETINFFGYFHKLEFVDIDGDGDLDAFTPAYDGCFQNNVFFFYNDGSATWGSTYTSSYSDSSNPFYTTFQDDLNMTIGAMSFVDLDRDGDLDCFMQGAFFYRDDATGDFLETPQGLLPGQFQLPFSPKYHAFFDIDNDGDQDILATDRSFPNHVRFLRNDNSLPAANPGDLDGFTEVVDPKLSAVQNRYWGFNAQPTFVDVDNDGDKDLVILNQTSNFYFFENTGNYNLERRFTLENPFGGVDVGSRASPSIVDIDQDGDQDVFIGSYNNGVQFYNNDGSRFQTDNAGNQLAFLDLPPYNGFSYNNKSIEFVDFDQDGDIEGVFMGTSLNDAFFYFQNNNPIDNTQTVVDLVNEVEFAIGSFNDVLTPTLGDIDGDGDLDALVAGIYQPPYYPTYFINDGSGNFQGGVDAPNLGDDSQPELVDIDHDGDADGIMGTPSGTLRFFESDGGDFASMTEFAGVSNPFQNAINSAPSGFRVVPEMGDLDGDGDLDLVLGRQDGRVDYARNENQPPTINPTLDPGVIFTERGTPVALAFTAAAIQENDPDTDPNTHWINVTMTIINPDVGDVLIAPDPATLPVGMTATYNPTTYTLELSGHNTISEFSSAIQMVEFSNPTNTNPQTTRTIEFLITDDDATVPTVTAGAITLPIAPVNNAPSIIPSVPSVTYTENDPPLMLNILSSIIEPDENNLQQVTISISNNFQTGEDVLAFTDQNGIVGSYDTATGVLTLSGSATPDDYLVAINTVTYVNTSEDPSGQQRQISIQVTDGNLQSNVVFSTLNVLPVNDLPVVDGATGTKNYALGTLDFFIDDQMTVSDLDDANISEALVQFEQNYIPGKDILTLGTTNGITGNFISASGQLVLTGNAPLSDYQDALRSITYFNPDDPNQPDKEISVRITDQSGGDSNPFSIFISVANPITAAQVNSSVTVGETIIIDVLGPSDFPASDNITVSITQDPTQGTAIVLADQSIEYTAELSGSGGDVINYEICNQNDVCSGNTINIDLLNAPPIIADADTKSPPGGTATIDLNTVISDDEGNIDPNSVRIVSQPSSGAPASIDGSLNLTVDYSNLTFTGVDLLTIEVCDLSGECSQTEIEILVGEIDGVTVYNALSPNGDGIQDYTRILDIEFFPQNSMVVYNRMGNQVWKGNNYDNTSVIFEGFDDNGNELPDGTYYYTLELTNLSGDTIRQRGYIVINR